MTSAATNWNFPVFFQVDLNHVYGETLERQHKLRLFKDGKMKYQVCPIWILRFNYDSPLYLYFLNLWLKFISFTSMFTYYCHFFRWSMERYIPPQSKTLRPRCSTHLTSLNTCGLLWGRRCLAWCRVWWCTPRSGCENITECAMCWNRSIQNGTMSGCSRQAGSYW